MLSTSGPIAVATPALAAQAFVMLDAEIRAPGGAAPQGYYDPESQTWIGDMPYGFGTSSSRSNGARGGYSYQYDD